MAAISDYGAPTTDRDARVRNALLRPLVIRGLFGFGILSIALAQASQSIFDVHFGTITQIIVGLLGGSLGARSSRRTDDRG